MTKNQMQKRNERAQNLRVIQVDEGTVEEDGNLFIHDSLLE